ncbi:septum formation protein [Lacrimispora xylanisolvens]|jgi:septum formation protein|uniref:dTTP/UTP pyrophosphatase n=1 Tax=Lacrimispora xylanisolvens TaxID=384636 RepID=A0A2S6HX08_9FIRM|nr:Maf family protein [Hungatella xylanolytica]MBE5987686.1 septum formation protein Maf [Paenibacillaceae bacterium]PPK82541.1 septum formation protein [Hungatella xylanolytica]
MIRDYKIVLASASPRRRELLSQISLNPVIEPSTVIEVITTRVPEDAVMELSLQKAEDVARHQQPGTIVIGADTVVAAEGKILGKPKSHQEAYEMIESFQGKTHQVFTGVTLIYCGTNGTTVRSFAERTDVHVYPMTPEEIRLYAEDEEPMDKAGAYGIQGRFAAFIKGIDGDYSNVVGLPVGRVYQELKQICEQEEKA